MKRLLWEDLNGSSGRMAVNILKNHRLVHFTKVNIISKKEKKKNQNHS